MTTLPTTKTDGSSSNSTVTAVEKVPYGLMPRGPKKQRMTIAKAAGHEYILSNGQKIYDASSGAAVSCLGPGARYRIVLAMIWQMIKCAYVPSSWFDTPIAKEYAQALLNTTNGAMSHVMFWSAGSLAVEGMMKLILQYHGERGESDRKVFIARHGSYHGATLGSLAIGGHQARREPFAQSLMNVHHLEPCYPYRYQALYGSAAEYLKHLKEELRQAFRDLGPGTVAAFVVEPVVGAALGCVTSIPGYLQAMKNICHENGALFVVDEIMCGMGRTGYLHAWQHEGIVPDLSCTGKGMAGGFQEISALLIKAESGIAKTILEGRTGYFNHGHTFENAPIACAAALEVLKIIQKRDLLSNVRKMGDLLKQRLQERLSSSPYVGDVRGRGLFIGIEFVSDKLTKKPFNHAAHVASGINLLGLEKPHRILVYPGSGSVKGMTGDHIIIAPAFDVCKKEVDLIVDRVGKLIDSYFDNQFAICKTLV